MTVRKGRGWSVGRTALPAMGLMVLITGCGESPAEPKPEAAPAVTAAPAAPSVVPSLSINELMVNWVDNASHVMWDTEWPEGVPKDDADWTEVEDHATQLIAAATLLQLGGTGPQDAEWVSRDSWKTYAIEMGNAGKAGVGAARAKSMPALLRANTTLVGACEGCHKAFKPDLPTEGKMHQNPHSESHRTR